MRNILIAGVVFILIVIGAMFLGQKNAIEQGPIACTLEAKLCPDGSAVGRSGPLCEFAKCPEVDEVEKTVASLGQRILNKGVYVTPLQVTEDSRCPVDVVCIQAGTVTLQALLEVNGVTQTAVLSLGTPLLFAGKRIILENVTPVASSVAVIEPNAYRFEFAVSE